jgi:hypothetical protein
LLGPLQRANLNHWTHWVHLRTETDPVSETYCFSSNYLESGLWTKSENPVILCIEVRLMFVQHSTPNFVEKSEMTGIACDVGIIRLLEIVVLSEYQ